MDKIASKVVAIDDIEGNHIADVEFNEKHYCLEVELTGITEALPLVKVFKTVLGERTNVLVNINAIAISNHISGADNFLFELIKTLYGQVVPFALVMTYKEDSANVETPDWKLFIQSIKGEVFDMPIKSDVWVQRIAAARNSGLVK